MLKDCLEQGLLKEGVERLGVQGKLLGQELWRCKAVLHSHLKGQPIVSLEMRHCSYCHFVQHIDIELVKLPGHSSQIQKTCTSRGCVNVAIQINKSSCLNRRLLIDLRGSAPVRDGSLVLV